ncbi:nucleotidyltransferase family protein [Photobacterium damselae subsp. damselae]|uniref:nucleotidyltransferase family protein n=1 Tax=Photobacterium damselae TaxID=38293 RepID=UPI001F328815|nr:nucleotidyltransferase family protein [Photobacterium damselae]UJZ94571.1 nucleotidyltransferase family protein [Photobacterium damselae subsp. damselae]UJZ98554.1 nucleotidyltransferase family protein [Photobacterium damselae subsp. damselae]
MSYNWKKILLSPTSTIRDALTIIDNESLQIALVVLHDQLVGTVTDGDIRRGLLNNISLDDSIDKVMNKSPLTADYTFSKSTLISLLESKKISSIPILKKGELVGLETLHHLLSKPKLDNPVFIMAGGFGTRLRPLTDNCPKPLLKVGNKPILEIILQRFIDSGFHNFYISTHYLPEMIKDYFGNGAKWNINITYVHEETPLGTGGALGLLPDTIEQLPLIMINGDVLTNLDINALLEYHNKEDAIATMCVREYDYQIPYGVIDKDGNRVMGMTEKPTYKFHVNAGIYVVTPKLFNSVQKNTNIDMPTLLESYIQDGNKVILYPLTEYWLDIGQMNEYKQAQKDIISLGL